MDGLLGRLHHQIHAADFRFDVLGELLHRATGFLVQVASIFDEQIKVARFGVHGIELLGDLLLAVGDGLLDLSEAIGSRLLKLPEAGFVLVFGGRDALVEPALLLVQLLHLDLVFRRQRRFQTAIQGTVNERFDRSGICRRRRRLCCRAVRGEGSCAHVRRRRGVRVDRALRETVRTASSSAAAVAAQQRGRRSRRTARVVVAVGSDRGSTALELLRWSVRRRHAASLTSLLRLDRRTVSAVACVLDWRQESVLLLL